MPALAYDVVLVSDLRLPGATGRVLAAEIAALAAGGYRVALLHIAAACSPGPIRSIRRPAGARPGRAAWLDPDAACAARLAVLHHPGVFAHPPARVPRLIAEQPATGGQSSAAGSPPAGLISTPADPPRSSRSCWAAPFELAPAGPQIRAQLADAGWRLPLLPLDWPPLLDPAALGLPRRRAWRTPLVIGRHGALDRLSWPRSREELLEAYPDEPGLHCPRYGGARATPGATG